MDAEFLPGLRSKGLGKVRITFLGGPTDRPGLVRADVLGAGDHFTGSPFGTGHDPADARLDPGHDRAHAHRRTTAHVVDLLGGAPATGLLKTGVGGAGDGLAGAWFVAGHQLGAAGTGATDDLITVGDAEADLGRFRRSGDAAKGLILLVADVFVAGDQAARTRFVTGDPFAAADGCTGDPRAPQGLELADLAGGIAGQLVLLSDVLITRELPARTALITSHQLGAAHHYSRDFLATSAQSLAHLAGSGCGSSAPGAILVGGDILSTGHQLASARFIARDLLGATDLVAGDAIALAGGGDAHLGWLGAQRSALAKGIENLSSEVFSTGDRAAGAGFVTRGGKGTVGLGAGDGLALAGFGQAHLPTGVGCGRQAGAVAVGATGTTTAPIAGRAGRTDLALEFAHLLGQFPTGKIWVGLACHGGSSGAGGSSGRFTPFRQGFPSGQDQGPAGVVLGRALDGGAAVCGGIGGGVGTGVAVTPSLAAAARGAAAQRTGGIGSFCFHRGSCGRDRRWGGLLAGDFAAGAIAGIVSALAAAGEGFAASQHQITAGIGDRPSGTAAGFAGPTG